MFNMTGGTSLLAGQHDLQKERAPPAHPIPVTFPSLAPPDPSLAKPPASWVDEPHPSIAAHLIKLKKPSDVSLDTLALLNITFGPQSDFETIIPSPSNNGQSYVPPKSWLDPPSQSEPQTGSSSTPPVILLSNGRRAPDQNEFYMRARELLFKKEDAFLNLTRKSGSTKVPLRLAHFRKFWEGLDNLAYYWDNTLDEYLPPKPNVDNDAKESGNETSTTCDTSALQNGQTHSSTANGDSTSTSTTQHGSPDGDQEPRKKAKMDEAVSNETPPISTNPPILGSGNNNNNKSAPIHSSKALPARTTPPKLPWAMNMQSVSEKPADLSKGSYRGYRIGNGADMPEQYRLDCVRSFLEPITWSFGVTFSPHRRPPVLTANHVRFPVRMNSVGWRGPTDRLKARQGWMEGPLLGLQCRSEVEFGPDSKSDNHAVLDVVRELGGMLLLAQERARHGKTELKSGEGKWWVDNPRWGGGRGGEVGEATGGASDTAAPMTQESAAAPIPIKPEEKAMIAARFALRERRRPSPAEVWAVLRPGNPIWDHKIVYEAIGKEMGSDWDDIFMVSSLNHHISVVKLHIHKFYIQHLTDGTLPDPPPEDPQWCSPVLTRTRWYDLFVQDDRTEAMRGIWGVMGYLMRTPEQKEVGDTDTVMKDGA